MDDQVINKRKPHLWWDQPWTLIEGCTRCSAGCKDCWSLALEARGGRAVEGGGIRLRRDRLDCPLHWRKPRVVAVWNDLFHEDVPTPFVVAALAAMALEQEHTYLLLTKRRDLRRAMFTRAVRVDPPQSAYPVDAPWLPRAISAYLEGRPDWNPGAGCRCGPGWNGLWPLPNVWQGVTCESNEYLWRVEELVQTPAAVRWVNAHLLGPLDLWKYEVHGDGYVQFLDAAKRWVDRPPIDWLAIECNRPFRGDPAEWWGWCESLVVQATAAGVPVWVKQGPLPSGRVTHDLADFPDGARRRELPEQGATR